jgi:hypothetical protein
VIRLTTDVVVIGDSADAETLAWKVIGDELEGAKRRILARLRELEVDVSINPPTG